MGESSSDSVFNMTEVHNSINDMESLPSALIFTNLPLSVFEKSDSNIVRAEFERLLGSYDSSIKIAYLKNFRRARVKFTSGPVAALVKYNLHETQLDNTQIKAYFVQIPALYDTPEKSSLNPPKLEKQFLISPPASPPVGWEPITEHEPIINYDIIHAMLSLGEEGGQHEIHSGCEIQNIPKIVVHLTPDDNPFNAGNRPTIQQTRRPPNIRQ